LVNEHVKLHDGTVSVESSKSGGARFVVSLPLAPEELTGDGEFDDTP
jgi:signal transduction histidine kinase